MNHKFLGIINITPDSFSDGGLLGSPEDVINKIKLFSKAGHSGVDIGAESTAPMNEGISHEIELSRLEKYLFNAIDQVPNNLILSFDTYKVGVITSILKKLNKNKITNNILWNDVSGKLNSEVTDLLKEYSSLTYVLCHNETPERATSGSHMDYMLDIPTISIVEYLIEFFKEKLKNCSSESDPRQIILDPCFGFSKNYEQNIYLLNNLDKLIHAFPKEQEWMIGISRKSFLKKMVQDEDPGRNLVKRELLQSQYIGKWRESLSVYNLIYRVHEWPIKETTL